MLAGWGGVSVFPSIGANFSEDLRAVSLETSGWDAMVSELEAIWDAKNKVGGRFFKKSYRAHSPYPFPGPTWPKLPP